MPGIILSTINARYMHASLGLRWLYANLGELQAQTCIQEYCLTDQITDIAEKILADDPEIVGIGVYIWNAVEVQHLVAILKRVAPATHVILGGPEVSHLPLRVDLSEADYLIQGEAEQAFPTLCRSLSAGQAPAEPIITAAPVPVASLHLPYRFYTDEDLIRRVTYVEASRGCPFSCEFCLSSLDKEVRAFDINRFLEAMEQLWQRGARTFKFVDRTFNSNPTAAGRILDYFLGKEPPFNVHFEVIPDHFPSSLKERFTRFPAEVLQLEVGIQTLHPETAAHINRRLDFDRIRENLSFLARETTAHLHVDLIVGLPGESIEQFGENLNTLTRLTKGEIQIGILKKLSGTAINRHDQRFAMVYSPYPPYEILHNNLISFARMQEMKRLARFWDLVYNSGNFKQTAPLLWPDGDVFQGFLAFSRWLYSATQTTWQIGLPRLAELLFRYLVDRQGHNHTEVANRLAADILVFKGRVLPAAVREHVTHLPRQQSLPNNLTRRQSRHQQGADRG
ncbi:B12-binding domain-containing radical SAM protein [Desulfobulbus alkaliphilus]|uniref:B12-binding domain-containing radical SAM protein n=1 Tax=Desulfobulbus alkaliphilus TaxID=869814 RepID=UPI001963F02C|nr:radical SAM protein [Desulfobulbus alkaliphilus]MBM9536793.1 B12-binding domain-containing radical SAM protein [Desulfobulbus alkaliphilus]